jgi:hypothetical protein
MFRSLYFDTSMGSNVILQVQQQQTLSSSLGATSNRRSYPQSIQTNNAGASGAAGTPPKMQARGAQPLVAAGFDRPVQIHN